jgi:hypothetical protein
MEANQGPADKAHKWNRKLETVNTCDLCGMGAESEFHAVVLMKKTVKITQSSLAGGVILLMFET